MTHAESNPLDHRPGTYRSDEMPYGPDELPREELAVRPVPGRVVVETGHIALNPQAIDRPPALPQ